MGTPAAVKVGPGLIYVAPIGTSEPTNPTATIPSAWIPVGYTEEGHTFTPETSFEPIEVAEELDELRNVATKRSTMFEFEAAEITVTNLSAAYNGGTIGTPSGGFVSIEPPDLGAELRLMIYWRGDDTYEDLVLRRCLQVGAIGQKRQKAPNKTTIPMQFKAEIPLDGSAVFEQRALDTLSYEDPHT